MFDGVPEQFHQFISSRTSLPTLPNHPLSYPIIHGSSSVNTFSSSAAFDIYPSQSLHPLQPHFLHPLDQPNNIHKDNHKQENTDLVSINMEIERQEERSMREAIWSSDEILALLKIGSTMENWYPDITWEHVSRTLAEMGFKRSGEECKEKLEEESRYFNSMSTYNKNCRLFGALEELCHGENPHHVAAENHRELEKDNIEKEDSMNKPEEESKIIKESAKEKKRKREQNFEMFKSFCEDVVNNLLTRQEDMHNKLIEDMVKREEELIAKEEARKKVEMDRMNKELEIIAQEQAIAGDRQAKIAEYLNKITANNSDNNCTEWRNNEGQPLMKVQKTSSHSTLAKVNTSTLSHANSTSSTMSIQMSLASHENPSSSIPRFSQEQPSQNHTSKNIQNNQLPHISSSSTKKYPQKNSKDEIGKRWPRDEVLALINMRCNVNTNNEDKDGASTKVPIWERISQGMLELGYKRSAKRCKEKWENINKYFRKNKNVNKKRSLDSRTCPYFHQLSSLYHRGNLENAENHLVKDGTVESSQGGSSDQPTMHAVEGEKNNFQLSGFDYEY